MCVCVGVCVVEIRHLQCDRFAFKTFQANENPQAVNALPVSLRRIQGKHLVRMIEFQKSTMCLISIIISQAISARINYHLFRIYIFKVM